MDKEIDITSCEHYENGCCNAHPKFDYTSEYRGNKECSKFPNCLFRQLQKIQLLKDNIEDVIFAKYKDGEDVYNNADEITKDIWHKIVLYNCEVYK